MASCKQMKTQVSTNKFTYLIHIGMPDFGEEPYAGWRVRVVWRKLHVSLKQKKNSCRTKWTAKQGNDSTLRGLSYFLSWTYLLKSEIRHRFHKNSPLDRRKLYNPVHVSTPCFWNINFDIILPSRAKYSTWGFPTTTLRTFRISLIRATHPILTISLVKIWIGVYSSRLFLNLPSIWAPFSETRSMSFHYGEGPNFKSR
jgi:hypothetical protein